MRNILTDASLSGSDLIVPIALSASFSIPAIALLWGSFSTRSRPEGHSRPLETGFVTLGGWTITVWIYKVIDIAIIDEHPIGFVVVHMVLAIISMVLGVIVMKTGLQRLGVPSAKSEKESARGGAEAKSGAR